MPMFPYWDVKDKDILPAVKEKKSSVIDEILQILSLSGKIPNFKTMHKYGVNGEYTNADDTIALNRFTGNSATTMAHELTHALRERMALNAVNWKYNPETAEQSRFSDAMFKFGSTGFKTGDPYRDSPEEEAAFGVGNYADSQKQAPWEAFTKRPGALHQDATNATEQAILRDSYLRALKSRSGK